MFVSRSICASCVKTPVGELDDFHLLKRGFAGQNNKGKVTVGSIAQQPEE